MFPYSGVNAAGQSCGASARAAATWSAIAGSSSHSTSTSSAASFAWLRVAATTIAYAWPT